MFYIEVTAAEPCLLCLEENPLTLNDYMDVFSAKAAQLNVVQIINKHFPIELIQSSGETRKICPLCWTTVSAFNTLHDFVSSAQSSLRETKVLLMEDDPLTQGNFKQANADAADLNGRNFFYPEVKIEEHELEQLPKIEVIEGTSSLQTSSPARRLRKRVKAESEPGNAQPESLEINASESLDIVEAPKKRRGRPRKNEVMLKPSPAETQTEQNLDLESCLKAEAEHPDDFSDDDQDFSAEFVEGLAHSDDSSEESAQSDDDSDFTVGKPDDVEFAVIPKRTPVRPKKYKKRAKPAEPRVRMSRELLDQRKKQQEEFDAIIAKFFSDVLPCSICNLLVHNFTEMQRHHRLTHQVDPGYMICCGRKFTQRKVLAEHVLVHWNPEHFKCTTCEKSFQNSRHLESHQQVHVSKLTFQCDLCSKAFLSKTAIDYHKLNKHVPKSEFKFSCSECNKKYENSNHQQYFN